MAGTGPSILLRILGDASGLAKGVQSAGTAAQSAGSKLHSAFSGVLSTLNKTGVLGPFGDTLQNIDSQLDHMGGHAKSTSEKLMGIGGVTAALGAGLSSFGSKEKAAHQQLQAAIGATGHSYDQFSGKIDEAIKHQERFGNSSASTQNALQTLTSATRSPAEALKLLNTASDLAAAKHISLNSAAEMLGRTYNGNARLLKQYGIVVDKHTKLTKDGQTATEALGHILGGQAAAQADTFNGKLKALGTTVEDRVSEFGSKFGPAITGAGVAMTGFGAAMEGVKAIQTVFKGTQEAATAATEAQAAAEDGAAVSSWAMLGPILLVIAAIAALVAIGYVIYRNWGTIWGGMKAAVKAVWDWIRVNWPLLVGILFGPIGIAAALIARYWRQILSGIQGVWNWIRGAWSSVFSFLASPVIQAANVVKSVWNGVLGFFSGMRARLAGVFSGMWGGLTNTFRAVVNGIASIWNNTIGRLSFKVPGWVPGVGGKGFSAPTIPHMAQGGLITSSGLIFAHAGEAITPMPSSAMGPAVVVEHAEFGSGVDIDLFMRRVAWNLQKAKV